MSSLVHKQRQQVVEENNNNAKPSQQKLHSPCQTERQPPKKALEQRSFEKLLATAFHIRLACSKCSRESLKMYLEMLITRSRVIAQHSIIVFKLLLANLLQLPTQWNNTLLELASVRQQRRQGRGKHPVSKADDIYHTGGVVGAEKPGDDVRLTDKPNYGTVLGEAIDQGAAKEQRTTRQSLTIAVAGCIVLLAAQISIGVSLLVQNISGVPWGLFFLVACVVYIAYLLQSICDYDLMNRTTYTFGRAMNNRDPTAMKKRIVIGRATKIELSFIEKTMSKVKLL